ncbi:hypothetical protein DBR43_05755 [Pedobacter sp. KBW06]|uniref:hypothetical protein n=1 Tax=Pedobacter sp. KBW06 TaxID=2153359 RepID=UPI000F59374B|nr:hypothetical protein [Pedobacter sp. KBW06]RQO74884.1 hypothetical protein DBR43_05755 [Pedobacter sp. KBW06]
MSEINQYAALEYLVGVLQKAIIGSKVKQITTDESAIIDGNASIRLKLLPENNGNPASIFIRDEKEILYSEELLEEVYKTHERTDHPALAPANIMINGLNIEAELIFHAVRDQFYTLSGSYEFKKFIERNNQQVRFSMTFGDELTFEFIISNESDLVTIEALIAESAPAALKAVINTDVETVSQEINKQFKKG